MDGQSHFLDVSGRGIRTFGCLVDGLLGSLRLFLGRHLFLAPFHRGVPIGLAAGDRLANLPLGNDIGLQRHGLLGRTHTQREHRGQQRGRNEREQRTEVQCERTDQHNDRDCQQ